MKPKKSSVTVFAPRSNTVLLVACVLVSTLLLAGRAAREPEGKALEPGVDFVPGEVIVTFLPSHMPVKGGVSLAEPRFGVTALDIVIQRHGAVRMRKLTPSYDQGRSESKSRLARTFLIKFGEGTNIESVIAELSRMRHFELVTFNRIVKLQFGGTNRYDPTVPGSKFPSQWNLDNEDDDRVDIDAPEAWAIERGSPEVIVGIHDSGAMIDTLDNPWSLHSDFNFHWINDEDLLTPGDLTWDDIGHTDDNGDGLNDNIIGYNWVQPDARVPTPDELGFWHSMPTDIVLTSPPKGERWKISHYNAHGTQVASIAVGQEAGSNIVGVAFDSKAYFVRAPVAGQQFEETNDFDLAESIYHAASMCDVINMSWGFVDPLPTLSEQAIAEAAGIQDCVLVACTGNDTGDNGEGIWYPAAYPEVLAVGAIDSSIALPLSSYSNWDNSAEMVDVVAPVDNVIWFNTHTELIPNEDPPYPLDEFTAQGFGTSFAAPQAAGIAALLLSRFPNLAENEVRERIENSAEFYWVDNVTNRRMYGRGKVNAYRALTEWGEITGDVTWNAADTRDATYYVSGDLVIPAGAVLTINEGTTVKIAPDHEKMLGNDADRVEIIVEGTLVVAGTSANPVVFESFTDSSPTSSDWVGFRFASTSQNNSLQHAVIKNAQVGIDNSAPVVLSGCTIQDGHIGIRSDADIQVSGSTISDMTEYGAQIISGAATMQDVTISDCYLGIWLTQDPVSGVASLSCSDSYIYDVDLFGVAANAGNATITLTGTDIENTSEGVKFQNGNGGTIDGCTIHNSDTGVRISQTSQVLVINTTIDNCTGNGIHCSPGGNIEVAACTISNCGNGVFCELYSHPTIHDGTWIKNNNVGIRCDYWSSPTVRSCQITDNVIGVSAINEANPDLGGSCGIQCQEPPGSCSYEGLNSITGSSAHHVVNLSPSITIMAECNYWGRRGPLRYKFSGAVDYNPYRTTDPTSTAPLAQDYQDEEEQSVAETTPGAFALSSTYPNPFNPSTTIGFDVPSPGGFVQLMIYNVKGQIVRKLLDEYKAPGFHTETWNGSHDHGEPVASGVFFVRMTARDFSDIKKIVLLK
jgi:hypothetical protein